jgi:hypothetical protein
MAVDSTGIAGVAAVLWDIAGSRSAFEGIRMRWTSRSASQVPIGGFRGPFRLIQLHWDCCRVVA